MTIPSEPRTPSLYHVERDSAFSALEAVGITAAGMGSFLLVAGLFARATGGFVALALGELMFVIVPVAAALYRKRPLRVLGVARFGVFDLVAAILIGCSLWYLNMRLADGFMWLLDWLQLPVAQESVHSLQELVGEPSLPFAVFVLAVVPAICEELLFRGVLARALAARRRPLVAILVSAAVFAAYHLSLVQLVPTFTLGLVLAALGLHARSIIPCMLAHFLNNAIAILISRGELAGVAGWMDTHPAATTAGAMIGVSAGLTLIARRAA